MLGLNIHLKSFKLNPNIVNGNDKVRVSITTLPEQNKEAFITEAKQMFCVHHFFTVNISDKTERIVFAFRKKGIFDDPIIASSTISAKELPTSNQTNNTEMKTFNIYEPVQNGHKIRRVYGEMQIQFSLTSAFPSFKPNKSNEKVNKVQGYSKVNGYSRITNENQKRFNSIFADDEYN